MRRAALLLLAPLLVATTYACRQRSSNVETPTTHSDSGTPDATPPFAPKSAGAFQCTLQIAGRSLAITACGIDTNGALSIVGPVVKLQGTTKQTAFGLEFKGSIALEAEPETMKIELFHQGAGNLAAVFVLANGKFAKLNLVPAPTR